MGFPVFEAYKEVIRLAQNVHDPRLLMSENGKLKVQYACFDYVNEDARIILMGITPGEQQANESLRTARSALLAGLADVEVVRRAKVAASFAGPMRANLTAILDYLGVAAGLGIPSSSALWDMATSLVHFTSALRYPVFTDGVNYGGNNPKIEMSDFLKNQVLFYTGEELARIKNALLIPLGPAAVSAAKLIVSSGKFPSRNVILGMPHPCGANGERIAFFLERKLRKDLSSKTDPEKLDRDRASARLAISSYFG